MNAVSVWRGIEIHEGDNSLTAEIRGVDGVIIERIERKVHYSITPTRATLVRERSILVADGVTTVEINVINAWTIMMVGRCRLWSMPKIISEGGGMPR